MTDFSIKDWRAQLMRGRNGLIKEVLYKLARPLLNIQARQNLSSETIRFLNPYLVLPERGFPLATRRKWGSGFQSLAGKTILVQGVGNGWDVASWAEFRPDTIIGIDLFEFPSWPEVCEYAATTFGVEVEFIASPLHELSFIADRSVDICASDAVFEHIDNLPAVMRETFRILKDTGMVYATYGPMWYCAGGDHFSGRGGLREVFNHVLLDEEDFKNYYETHRQQQEDFQSGGRYIELDLFSRLTSAQYLSIFRGANFTVDSLILEISRQALLFRTKFPEVFNELQDRNKNCLEDDFIIKANFVRLRKDT